MNQKTCNGCGAPFCASGCEYCGAGPRSIGGERMKVSYDYRMQLSNYMTNARLMQDQNNAVNMAARHSLVGGTLGLWFK